MVHYSLWNLSLSWCLLRLRENHGEWISRAPDICSVWVSAVFLLELFLSGSPSFLSLEFCIKEILQGLQPQQRPGLGTWGARLGVRTLPTKAGDSEDVNSPPPQLWYQPLSKPPCPSPLPQTSHFPYTRILFLKVFSCLCTYFIAL